MYSQNLFAGLALEPLFDSILPDFVLAFTLFTALCYAVLGQHFGRQRPAAAMAFVLGLALAVGLVSWEVAHGWSARDLGPSRWEFCSWRLSWPCLRPCSTWAVPGPA